MHKMDESRVALKMVSGERLELENSQICKECGGICCLRAPCHWSPRDIEDLSYEGLKKFLKEKKYISIVRFPGYVTELGKCGFENNRFSFYILRTRTRGTNIASIGKNLKKDDLCMLLKPDGCSISFEERPRGARLLVPKREEECEHLYDLYECISEWKDYQDVLRKLFWYFRLNKKWNKL